MPLPARRVLVLLLLAGLAALVASTARPAGELPLKEVSIGNDLPPASGARLQANDWAGTWTTTYGIVLTNWVQSGNHVSGNWIGDPVWAFGTMEGTVTGNVLRGRWTQSNPETIPGGRLELTLSADGKSFDGWWSWDNCFGGCVEGDQQIGITAYHTSGGDTDTAPPAAASSRPKVKAFRYPGVAKPGTPETPEKPAEPSFITLKWSVKDDSGHAKARITLFEGGQYIQNVGYNGPATGKKRSWTVPLGAKLKGPLFFCVWAKDAAGNKSAGAPRSSCGWISLLVPIERVSNGCGGEGWDSVVAIENYFGNTSTYIGAHGTYTVSFVDACNLHDAGYGGQTVEDTLNGGAVIDFSTWTRRDIDEKFRADMWKLCDSKIPESEPRARSTCYANFRYDTVRKVGNWFFDADPMTVGTQDTGTRSND